MTFAIARKFFTVPRLTLVGTFQWILDADARFRERCHMREMTDEQLDDVGLCRNRYGEVVRQ